MKTSRRLSLLAGACLAVAAAAPAHATITVYNLTMSGAQESPQNNSTGTGSAIVTLDDVANTMRLQMSFTGLAGTTTAAHIHCCTSSAFTGTTGVATTTPFFVGFPTSVTSGSMDQTYNMTLAGSYNAAFITANGGTPSAAFSVLKTGIESGLAYLNVHTSAFPGGEIRSFIAPVPEASTWATLGAGLAAVAALARRRRA